MPSMTEALAAKAKHASNLMKISGVVAVGVGGTRDQARIIVYVEELTEKILQQVPKELDNVQIEILERGLIERLKK